jgi:hypothetical protein
MSIDQSSRSRSRDDDVVSPLDVLSLCEGFRVESADGYVGVVSSVRHAPSARWDRPSALAVRPGHSSTLLLIVQAAEVESVSLAERRIVLRSSPSIAATEPASAFEPATESLDRGEAKAPSADEGSRAYWLRTCEGFRVDSKDGRVGVVEEVRFSSDKQPEALAVRTGLFRMRLLIVPVNEVRRVVPRRKRIFLGSTKA